MTLEDAVHRPVLPLMRVLLLVGCAFVLAAGTQLFVLAESTDLYFAWTIRDPLAAAVVGSFYYGAFVISALSARERAWGSARVGIPGILVFLWLMLVATLTHLSAFHLDATGTAGWAAWAWLIIYIVDPPLLLLACLRQTRLPGSDPPRLHPLPTWYRAGTTLMGVPLAALGGALFVAPAGDLAVRWPWPLAPLAAQATAAWLVALGLLLVAVARDGDARRARPALAGEIVLGVLLLLSVLRYPGSFRADTAGAAWLALLIVLIVLGAAGLAIGRRAVALARA